MLQMPVLPFNARRRELRHAACLVAAGLCLAGPCVGQVPGALDDKLMGEVRNLAGASAQQAPAGARVEVEVGKLDPRLRLAPCAQVQTYLPVGLPMWGRTRVGLRCVSGPSKWNVSLPVTVKVFAPALVAKTTLPGGAVLLKEHLTVAEMDIASEPGAVFNDPAALLGRILSRPVAAGEVVRSSSLKQRQWFAAGETVMVRASGPGFAVAGEGQALSPGLEGQDVRVRFENGRTVMGRATGDRRVEVGL
jgi:flagella basal body P-ring formation protein FlgA